MNKTTAYRLTAGIFVLPLVCILLGQFITLQSAADSIDWFFRNTAAAVFLYLFLLFCTVFLYGLTGRLWIASLLTNGALLFITIISYFKTVINGTPLMLNDLTLARQFGNVAHFTQGQLHLSAGLIAAVLLFLGAHGFLMFIERKMNRSPKLRIACIAAGAQYLILFFFTSLFSGVALNIADADASQEERVADLGVVMSLYCAKLFGDSETVSSYEDVELVKIQLEENEYVESETKAAVTPTVIFLMSESFFDVTELPGVSFEEDPVANYHALEGTCTSGKFLSSTYCGGTAYVEMEVLTGLCSYLLRENDTLTSLPDALYGRMPVITDVFKNYGYSTCFLHSYNNVLYNRAAIYRGFGFDSVQFSDSFSEDAELRGGYISDLELSKKIISLYEGKTPGQPLFLLGVSMENHQPYTGSKFGENNVPLFDTELLDEKAVGALNNYITGLRDADAALGYLVDYFSACGEPVMIVFWGDHLPNLSTDSDDSVYSQLGYASGNVTTAWGPEELTKMLSTDYLIWTNYEEAPEADRDESCNFMGLSVLKRLGFERTAYFSWLETHAYPEMQLYRPRLFVTRTGERYSRVPESMRDMLRQYSVVVHDIVYGDNAIFGRQTSGGLD